MSKKQVSDFLYERESYLIRGACYEVWKAFRGAFKEKIVERAQRESAGVTLIELLLVITIIAILGASVTPFLSNFILRNNLETTTDKVIGSIRKAQNYSMDGKDNAVWGVCTTGSHLRLFRGSCGSPDFSENFTVSGSVNVSGLEDPGITFSKLRGEPSSSLSVTISTEIDSSSVQVNAAGGMTIN